ncbi:hypothetical protein FNF29_04125 [Cafeteria roenbergensis]|uniref:Uncharacterized protein n=1 Tax=Cafeteria roenbergensis TaxID=33653 RepID=A0A5A8CIQ6_CAFRO|nr:hypothetical protein FNF29_04125 [Cafeteria roenbergensis]|eukprot:KAA0152010.1 hypothetical protein FNF29_04125 [Cafeteria roenbergensis]
MADSLANVDWFLVGIAIITPVLLTGMNYVVYRFYAAEDMKGNWLSYIFLHFCLLVAECTVLLLPFDVGNRSGIVGCGVWKTQCGGLDLMLVWQIVYCIVAGLVVVGVPFAIFYYETEDEGLSSDQSAIKRNIAAFQGCCGCAKVVCVAFTYTLVLTVLAVIVLLISWVFLSFAEIPYQSTVVDVSTAAFFDASTPVTSATAPPGGCAASDATCACGTGTCKFEGAQLNFQVTFVVYLGGLLSFVGWFLFVLYGGIGLVALPRDMYVAWSSRPKPALHAARELTRATLSREAKDVVKSGMQYGQTMLRQMSELPGFMERRRQRAETTAFIAKFRILVEELEEKNYAFQLSDGRYYNQYYNPLLPWCSLAASILLALVTVVWLVHVVLFMAISPPVTPFLNDYFTFFDTFASFIGTASLGLFCMYLLFAVVKGAFKFGARFLLCAVHPMQRRRTYLNSFFFNIALLLICVLPVVQFCTQAFSSYARLTDAGVIFGAQIQNLRFFKYLWQTNAFVYALLAIVLLSLAYFTCARSDAQYAKDLMEQVKKDVGALHQQTATVVAARGGASSGLGMRASVARAGAGGAAAAAKAAVRDW